MVNLNPSHYAILTSLALIKKHNSVKENMKLVFQKQRYNEEDLNYLIENKLARISLLGEHQITPQGEKEIKEKI